MTIEDDLNNRFEIDDTVHYVRSRGYSRVALQFPDSLLHLSSKVAGVLQSKLGQHTQASATAAALIACTQHSSTLTSLLETRQDAAHDQHAAQCKAAVLAPTYLACVAHAVAHPRLLYRHMAHALAFDTCTSTLHMYTCLHKPSYVQVCILADTTYNPLAVDEVAAAHMSAHCVVRPRAHALLQGVSACSRWDRMCNKDVQ